MRINKKKMKAIKTMQEKLFLIQCEQLHYVDKYDVVKPHCREKYLILAREAKKYLEEIQVLEDSLNSERS